MIVDSKKRGMLDFHALGGCDVIIQRLKFEARRPPPVFPETYISLSDSRHSALLPLSRQSLFFSLITLTENVLNPQLNQYLPPPQPQSLSSSEPSLMRSADIVLSSEFSSLIEEVLNIAPKGCVTLLSAGLSLIESLIGRDVSHPKTLTHFLSCGLVRAAWVASCRPDMSHEEDSLMSIIELVASLCATQEGLDIILAITPFPVIFRNFHDPTLLLSETATLVSCVPEILGRRLGELVSEHPPLLLPCASALLAELAHISDIALARTTKRCLLEEDNELVHQPNDNASVDQGDLKAFYFALAVVRCLDQLADYDGDAIMKKFFETAVGPELIKMLLTYMRVAVGSDSYLLISLACRGRNNKSSDGSSSDPNSENGLFINSFPGFPPLVMALIGLQNKAWLTCPNEFAEIAGKEIKNCSAILRKKLSTRLGQSSQPFHGLLSSVSPLTESLCNYTDPQFTGSAANMQNARDYTEVLRLVTYLSQLVFVLTEALKFRRSRVGDNEKDEADLDGLFGSMHTKKEKDSKKKDKKNSTGTLQNILNDLLEGNLYLSCVKEQIRGQVNGLWDTAAKKGTGEESVAFKLLVIWSRVTVKTGPGAEFKRISRIDEGCTLNAEKRLTCETGEGKASFCLSSGDMEGGARAATGTGTGTGKGSEKWISAYHPTAYPPSELVNIISVDMKKKAATAAQKKADPKGDTDTATPSSSNGVSLRSPVISFQMAGAAALSLFERSVQELISLMASKVRSEASRHRLNPTDAVEYAGALLRPFAVYLPFTSLRLTLGIISTSIYTPQISLTSPPNSGKLLRLISYSHGLRLCSHLIFSKEVGSVSVVNELSLMKLVTYGSRTAGDHGIHDNRGYTFDDDDEFYDEEYSAPDTGNLLEALLICSVRLFNACLPECSSSSSASATACKNAEAVEEEIRCVSLAAMTTARGVLHFWLTILQYISASHMTPSERALEAAYDTEDVFSAYRLKMTLCEVLLRKDNLPALWTSSRLSEYPRAITETVCKMLQEAHRAVYRCVSYSNNLEKSAEEKLKKKSASLTVNETDKKDASANASASAGARNGSNVSVNGSASTISSAIPSTFSTIQALGSMADCVRSFAETCSKELGKGMEVEEKEMEMDKRVGKDDSNGVTASATGVAGVAKEGEEEVKSDLATVYTSPYAAWIGGEGDRLAFMGTPKPSKPPKKDPLTIQSANYKKKISALRFLIPMSLYNRSKDMKMYNSRVFAANCDESWSCYSFLFRDINEGPAWQLQLDTCRMFLSLLEGECFRGRDPKSSGGKGSNVQAILDQEKDHWLWPFNLVTTDKNFPRTFFSLRVMELVHISGALHIPASITRAAKLVRQELSTKMEYEWDGASCPPRTADQSYSCAVGIVTWLMMRLSVLLPQAISQPAVLSSRKWRSSVSGLLLGLLNLLTGGAYRHPVSPAHQEGLILLITTHSDFKSVFSHLVTAIEEQNKHESQSLGGKISTSGTSYTPGMVRLGGDNRIEDAWVMTGLQVLDYVTRPYLPCEVGILYATKYIELKRLAVRAMDQCVTPIRPCGNFSAPLASDDAFIMKAGEWRAQAEAMYPPAASDELARVVTYELRQELGPRILDIALHLMRSLPRVALGSMSDLEGASDKGIKGERDHTALAFEHANEESFMTEAYRTCLQLIVHTVHDPTLAALFCSLSGLETVLALPPVPGGPLAVVDILHSCADSPRTISQRMAAVAVVVIQKTIIPTNRSGRSRMSLEKIGALSPMIPREPLIAYQVMRDILKAKIVSEDNEIGLPLCLQFEGCVTGCKRIDPKQVTEGWIELPSLSPSDLVVGVMPCVTEAVEASNVEVAESSAASPAGIAAELGARFAYSTATAVDTAHIIRLLFSRIDSLCSLCVSGTLSSENQGNCIAPSLSIGRRVCVALQGKGAEKVVGTGVEGQLTDCLNILADLLHCMPSRSSSISLGRECVGQGAVEGAGQYTCSSNILESCDVKISGSLVNYLVQTILLPSRASSSSFPSSSTPLSPDTSEVVNSELGDDGFSPECQTAVVYLLCSLLSVSGSKRISHDEYSVQDEVIQRGVYLSLIGGFESCLQDISSEEDEEKVGIRLKGLRALSMTVYWTLNRVGNHKFTEPTQVYDVIMPKAANSSCLVSDLPLPLLDVIVKACTFATIHIDTPSAAFCIQSLLHCSVNLLSYHGDQPQPSCSNDADPSDPCLSVNSEGCSHSSTSTCSQNEAEVEDEDEAEVEPEGLDLLRLFNLIESEVSEQAEHLIEQHQAVTEEGVGVGVGSEVIPSIPTQDSSSYHPSQDVFLSHLTPTEENGIFVEGGVACLDDADFDFGYGEDRVGMNAAIMESLKMGSNVQDEVSRGRGNSSGEDKEEGDWSDVESEVDVRSALAAALAAACEPSDGSGEDSTESDIPPCGGDLEDDEEEDDDGSNKGWEEEDSVGDGSMYSYLSGEENGNENEDEDNDEDDDEDDREEDNTEGTEDMARQGWSQGGGGLFGNNPTFAWTTAEGGASSDDDANSGSGSEEESDNEDSDEEFDDDSDDDDTYDTAEHEEQEEIDDDIFFNHHGAADDEGEGEDRDEEGLIESEDKFGEKPSQAFSNLCNPLPSTWGSQFPMTLQDTRFASQKSGADYRFEIKKEEGNRHFSDYELSSRRWGDFGTMGWRVVRSPYGTLIQKYLSPTVPAPSTSSTLVAAAALGGIEKSATCDDGLQVKCPSILEDAALVADDSSKTTASNSDQLANSADDICAPDLAEPSSGAFAGQAEGLERSSREGTTSLPQPSVPLIEDKACLKSEDVVEKIQGSDEETVGVVMEGALQEVVARSEREEKIDGERVIVKNLFQHLLPDLHLALLHVPLPAATSTPLSSSNPLYLRHGNQLVKYAFVDQYVLCMLALLPKGPATCPRDMDEESMERFTMHLCSTTARIQSPDPVLYYRTLLGELDATSSDLDILLRDKLMEKLRGDVTERLVLRLLDSSNSIWQDCTGFKGLLRIAMWHRRSSPRSEDGGKGKEVENGNGAATSTISQQLDSVIEIESEDEDKKDIEVEQRGKELMNMNLTCPEVCVESSSEVVEEHTFLDGLLRLLVHPSLSSAGRVLALHHISRIVKSVDFYSSQESKDSLPPTLDPLLLARYSPDMTVSEESISGLLYIAVHDISSSRDQRSFNLLFRVISIHSTNWYRILTQLVDIADAQIQELRVQVHRTLALVDSELRLRTGSPDISFLFPPDNELRLLRVIELMTFLSGVSNDSPVSSSHKSEKATDGSEEEEMKERHLIAIAALRRIHDNALWAELGLCLEGIKCLDDRSSSSNISLPTPSNAISPSRGINGSTSNISMTSSPATTTTSSIALSPAQCMQQLLVKPTYVMSPLSHGLVPLLECFFRSVCADLHAHAQVQALPALHNSLDPEVQHDLSAPGPPAHPLPPRTPSFSRTLSRIHAGTPFVYPPASSKVGVLALLTTFTSCTFRTSRTTTRPAFVLPTVSKGRQTKSLHPDAGASVPAATFDHLTQFCENNRSLLNALVRQNIRLLEGSLLPLLTFTACRKILDFDVKRAYLKLKLKRLRRTVERDEQWTAIDSQDDEETIPVEVERERIIECSYDALQHIKPRHLLRGKLDVMFENEDGVDGGGLTREWYSLLMREVRLPISAKQELVLLSSPFKSCSSFSHPHTYPLCVCKYKPSHPPCIYALHTDIPSKLRAISTGQQWSDLPTQPEQRSKSRTPRILPPGRRCDRQGHQ
jgi:hypothetical protein